MGRKRRRSRRKRMVMIMVLGRRRKKQRKTERNVPSHPPHILFYQYFPRSYI